MRKLVVLLCLLLAVSAVQATPVYITLTGQVIQTEGDTGVTVGDAIEQIWMYDLDVQGSNGTDVFPLFDHITQTGRFFADRISVGTIEPFYTLDIISRLGCIEVCNVLGMGFSSSTTLPGNGPWLRTVVQLNDGIPEMFHINMPFRMFEEGKLTNNKEHRTVITTGTITALSPVNPVSAVSEPSTAWLLLPGLLGLAFTYKSKATIYRPQKSQMFFDLRRFLVYP